MVPTAILLHALNSEMTSSEERAFEICTLLVLYL